MNTMKIAVKIAFMAAATIPAAASAQEAGRMLSVVTARVEGGVVTLTPAQLGKGVSVKVFWQDAGKAPVGEA